MAFLYRQFFWYPYAQQENIYSLKKHPKNVLIRGEMGRGSSTPWALCVHGPAGEDPKFHPEGGIAFLICPRNASGESEKVLPGRGTSGILCHGNPTTYTWKNSGSRHYHHVIITFFSRSIAKLQWSKWGKILEMGTTTQAVCQVFVSIYLSIRCSHETEQVCSWDTKIKTEFKYGSSLA